MKQALGFAWNLNTRVIARGRHALHFIPITQLKDDIGGNVVYLVTKPSFPELRDKTHIDSFAFVFTNKAGGWGERSVLIEQSTYTLRVQMLSSSVFC